MFFERPLESQSSFAAALTQAYRQDETSCVSHLLNVLKFNSDQHDAIQQLARDFVTQVRQQQVDSGGIEALMQHYDLSTDEGIILMCIAEALLRIPDQKTQDVLIRDKLTSANWNEHLGKSQSTFVNLATWSLALTGKVLEASDKANFFKKTWKNLLRKSGEPLVRQVLLEAVKVMSRHFILGHSIEEALKRSELLSQKGYRFSYDMLGEVARTSADADRYFEAYLQAIEALSHSSTPQSTWVSEHSISVKLSALYPRYEFLQKEVAIPFLTKRLTTLCQRAQAGGLDLQVDAEESDRLEMSLHIIEGVFANPEFKNWHGLGLAVQAYQKRAYRLIEYLIDMAKRYDKRIAIRLVKGAYWDSEIKASQINGLNDYPVFTRKASTDVSYLACARLLLSAQSTVYPQFATHNAHSVAAILTMATDSNHFEFQKLQGMGTSLHDQLVTRGIPCRVYAPVGDYKDLLPYLVRRLLENGANSSFVHRITDSNVSIDEIIADPITRTQALASIPNPRIPLPQAIYGEQRLNSMGIDLSHHQQLAQLEVDMQQIDQQRGNWSAGPLDRRASAHDSAILNPADHRDVVGYYAQATAEDIETALSRSIEAFPTWQATPVEERADILVNMAEQLECHRAELMMMAVREAGKSIPDTLSEVREAIDFCRYYAMQAAQLMTDRILQGPTGEENTLRLHGCGPMLCISPWNFPIAIFIGQIAAALVTGNTVIAKPAEQTPLVAQRIVDLFYQAGIPQTVLQLLPGAGKVGQALVEDERLVGVIFTGSTATAQSIQSTLAKRSGPMARLIAETGGINAMIVDSSALPEQVVRDVLMSAFGSAGQRCSALRLLCIQEDVAKGIITMLKGATELLKVGDPSMLATDVGPVIDAQAQHRLDQYAQTLEAEAHAHCVIKLPLNDTTQHGTYVAPQIYELDHIDQLKEEFFGPILHLVRYKASDLDSVIDAINAKGYALTFGIQSRIDDTVNHIQKRIKAGNLYVNRNMIGAVVGVQPFGGFGLSGTGPKAGGPHYLMRFCNESTLTIDTTAAGGNASLMALQEED